MLMMQLTDEGRQHIRKMSKLVSEVKATIEDKGAKTESIYVVLGLYDLFAVVEAPDNQTIARVNTLIAAAGNFTVDTFPAITIDELIEK
jgi:uncharacterized protein with GYD domain